MLVRYLLISLLAILVMASSASASDLIVIRGSGLDRAERRDMRVDASVTYQKSLPIPRAEVVSAANPEQALKDLAADRRVESVEPDYRLYKQSNDSYFGELWGLPKIGATNFWAKTRGSGVTVAVVDSGIEVDHPDLAGQIAFNPGESGSGKESNGIDDDANGYVDDYRGWNFIGDNNNPTDDNSHGSHVSGTIAAVPDNQKGIVGVSPEAKIMPIKMLNAQGSGSWSDLLLAFDYAGDMGVPIVNASLGATLSQTPTASLAAIINQHPNTLYVVAAGNGDANNNGLDLDVVGRFQAPCEEIAVNIICVGASDQSDQRASFSNYGKTSVDLFAPGVSILSTVLTSQYSYYAGTSMATPHVAGAAALLKADNPSLTASQIKTLLMNSTASPALLANLAIAGRLSIDSFVDSDNDSFYDAGDNCPSLANPDQADNDKDGVGNVCDTTPNGPDQDGDGVPDSSDNCPSLANPDQADNDKDGVGNICDTTPNGVQTDVGSGGGSSGGGGSGGGGGGSGDGGTTPTNPGNCGVDSDLDGVGDGCDPCPGEVNDLCKKSPEVVVLVKVKKKTVSARITVSTKSTVRVQLQRKRGSRYKTVKTVSGAVAISKLFNFAKLKSGSYRIVAQAGNDFGTARVTKAVKVR